jgi:uncharacterized membrane protein YbaN (DUF454 family)
MPPLHHLSNQSQRLLWMLAGLVSLVVGFIGIFLPLLPTTPFVLLAAFCFSRGSKRLEAWLLGHPRFGPMIVAWRRHRAVPLRAKQLATVMMAASAIGSWFVVHSPWRWAPAIVCTCVALWLWSLPTTPAAPPADD